MKIKVNDQNMKCSHVRLKFAVNLCCYCVCQFGARLSQHGLLPATSEAPGL